MEETVSLLFIFVESTGFLAPFVFIGLHLIRPIMFIPVAVVCMVGGILFGAVFGSIYSLIGLTVQSILFYFMFKRMPRTFRKLQILKQKWLGDKANFTIGQIGVLRLLPFINYHLLSLCIIEHTRSLKNYIKDSFLTNIPLAVFFTVFGQFIRHFSPSIIVIILLSLSCLFYVLRKKEVTIAWNDFFQNKRKSFEA
ncbi:VTT domain-containing protein [Bacillus timonensis]|nr:VTT domain-containing protein [Bacillus timonensis]